MPAPERVATRTGSMSRKAFQTKYLETRTPLVLRGAMTDTAAVAHWDMEFFASRYGSQRVPIDGIRSGLFMELGEYIERLRAVRDETEPVLYMRNLLLFETFPELRQDFAMPWIAQPNWLQSPLVGDYSGGSWRYWVELFLSGPGSRFPTVHIDPYFTHAWSIQLSGRKDFWLWPSLAEEREKMRAGEAPWQHGNEVKPDTELSDFFGDRECYRLTLEPGDLAFIPAGWWHTTETHEASLTLGGNFVESSNWFDFSRSYQSRNPTHSRRQALKRKASSLVASRVLSWAQRRYR
ncbi:MAG: cupin-like domain-containing protein [Kofleriaceae bacterium]|nr:cupin-like domain-containing protein [Kofleriaceae bacterium]